MARRRYTPEEIIQVLREVEIHTSQGKTVAEAVKQQPRAALRTLVEVA